MKHVIVRFSVHDPFWSVPPSTFSCDLTLTHSQTSTKQNVFDSTKLFAEHALLVKMDDPRGLICLGMKCDGVQIVPVMRCVEIKNSFAVFGAFDVEPMFKAREVIQASSSCSSIWKGLVVVEEKSSWDPGERFMLVAMCVGMALFWFVITSALVSKLKRKSQEPIDAGEWLLGTTVLEEIDPADGKTVWQTADATPTMKSRDPILNQVSMKDMIKLAYDEHVEIQSFCPSFRMSSSRFSGNGGSGGHGLFASIEPKHRRQMFETWLME